jgi:hypothetical protein
MSGQEDVMGQTAKYRRASYCALAVAPQHPHAFELIDDLSAKAADHHDKT